MELLAAKREYLKALAMCATFVEMKAADGDLWAGVISEELEVALSRLRLENAEGRAILEDLGVEIGKTEGD